VLGFVQVRLGFQRYSEPGNIGRGAYIAWDVVTGIWLALYLAGLALVPRQYKARKVIVQEKEKDSISGSTQELTGSTSERGP
jgi:hypothetical protein